MALDKYLKNSILRALGQKIELVRKSRGLTQAQLSAKSSVDTTYISKIESGISNPSITILIQLTWALNITLAELFSGKGRSKEN